MCQYSSYAYFSNLTRLWTPKKDVLVTRGMLFAKSNPHLCPQKIEELQQRMKYNGTKKIKADVAMNGIRLGCNDRHTLEIKVIKEFNETGR